MFLKSQERTCLDQFVSRSQAKRLLARIDRFDIVLFDFTGVDTVGPVFADEIFRVFERSHPNIRLVSINTGPLIDKMIARARSHDRTDGVPDNPSEM